jgi:hypothetical protein
MQCCRGTAYTVRDEGWAMRSNCAWFIIRNSQAYIYKEKGTGKKREWNKTSPPIHSQPPENP